jgi:O-antigen ligase
MRPDGGQQAGKAGAGSGRERWLFAVFAAFILGFYLLPSTRGLGSAPHDHLFYLLTLPVWAVLAGRRMWSAVGRGDPGSRLLALGLAFILYLGLSALWTTGDAELSLPTVALHTVATAAFLVASSEILDRDRWRRLQRLVVGAAVAIAGVSMAAFVLGQHSYLGRLNSVIHFEHPNLFAHYTGFAALICVLRILEIRRSGEGRVEPWMGAGGLLVTAVVLTQGRTTMAAFVAAAGLAVVVARDRRLAAAMALLVMTVVLGFLVVGGDWGSSLVKRGEAGRLFIYQSLLDEMDGRWWTGVGLAAGDEVEFPVGSDEFPRGFTMPHSHSAFVAALYHGGLIGLGLLLALVGAAGCLAWRLARKRGDPTGATLLLFGVVCLLPDGHRLVSNPHLSSWLIFWLPVGWVVAAARWQAVVVECPDGTVNASEVRHRTMPTTLFWALASLFIGLRLFHVGPELDTPNMWRQCDTAQYIRAFYEDGIDLLRPSVCWLADHRTTILEFPLPEAAAALGYHVFGPHHVVARMVFLLFFAGSAIFLYRFLRELVDRRAARMSVLISMIMPLALFYSRALHIDFSALFFVHGMAWFFAVGLRRESSRWMWAGSCFAAVALMIKAPYVLPVLPPLVGLAVRDRRWRFVVRSLPQLLLPCVVFGLWEVHVHAVNSRAPDWDFIPDYRKMVQSVGWYFGTVAQRLDPRSWLILGQRFSSEIVGALGAVPLVVGAVVMIRKRAWLPLSWGAGAVLMLLVFFNLCVVHNYYLIPFLAPVACLIAVGILWLADEVGGRGLGSLVLATALVFALAAEHLAYAERHYYGRLDGLVEGGREIARLTPDDALVVVSFRNLDCRSPHLLYHSGRYGWSIAERDLEPELLDRLRDLGAEFLAIVTIRSLDDELAASLASFDRRVVDLPGAESKLLLYDLSSAP